jgi:aspartyl aminopeptidase
MDSKDQKESKGPDFSFEKKFAFDTWDENQVKLAYDYCENYKKFLTGTKTERLAVKFAEALAKSKGYTRLEHIGESSVARFPTPLYSVNRNRAFIMYSPGKKKVREGLRLVLAHIDSPRLDLKVKPLYESEHIAFFKTHYYGGIKKYQWTAVPLAMYGTVAKTDGTSLEISLGDGPDDPVFMISDLLPHLDKLQSEKKLDEAIPAETLNILVGSTGTKNKDDKEPIKKNLLRLLNEKYGITEEDFVSADLEIVPQGAARDLGFDRSLIAAYGHDDRVCVYAGLNALLDSKDREYGSLVVLVDKEEIGSAGATSAMSNFVYDFISELIYLETGTHNENYTRDTLFLSKAISADVTAAFDPDYAEVYDSLNAARIGAGIVIETFTGWGGKFSGSEANVRFTADIRKIFNDAKINWQTGTLGKVDIGGGGTVAKYISHMNMDIIDIGAPLLSMHAPFEIASKADIYSAYLAYKAFFEAK